MCPADPSDDLTGMSLDPNFNPTLNLSRSRNSTMAPTHSPALTMLSALTRALCSCHRGLSLSTRPLPSGPLMDR